MPSDALRAREPGAQAYESALRRLGTLDRLDRGGRLVVLEVRLGVLGMLDDLLGDAVELRRRRQLLAAAADDEADADAQQDDDGKEDQEQHSQGHASILCRTPVLEAVRE